MITLGLDTTAKYCSASLVDGATVLASVSKIMARGHAEHLAPLVQGLLVQAALFPREIEKIVVCTGPGSFTGSRVALAFAKGFGLPHKIPIVGVDALTLWAETADPEHQKRVISVSDVRRGQLCWSAYDKGLRIQGPITEEAGDAKAHIADYAADVILTDQRVDPSILAWVGQSLSPELAPAFPLYSRPPDATLPGGITPPGL